MEKIEIKVFNKGENDLPNYSTTYSAGFDIRADLSRIFKIEDIVGNSEYFTLTTDGVDKYITLRPSGGRVLIPTGLFMEIPDNHELQIRARSGLALKHGVTVLNGIGTIDCVPKGTKIKTLNGDVLIEDLYKKPNKTVVLSYNEELNMIEEDILSDMWIVDNLNLIKVTTDDGYLIIPETKKVFTKRGWINAIDLNEEDSILTY